ncbi:bacteriocin-like protein [Chryseobacterium sp. MMS23-Vi53]|uniref:bacteriocin-like protein n=1 Tax=Chryseobacterium sp. MMS23-Vi53 TaxID=3386644 RepID=UPI0039E97ED9
MKSLKKLNRNDLKIINGGGLINIDYGDAPVNVLGIQIPIDGSPVLGNTCNVVCVVNGIPQVKVLTCGSTC